MKPQNISTLRIRKSEILEEVEDENSMILIECIDLMIFFFVPESC